MDTTDKNTRMIIGGVAIIIVLFGAWMFFARQAGNSALVSDTEVMATTTEITTSATSDSVDSMNPSIIGSGEAVTVRDQAAGDSVAVASVTLAQMGWVAVRDDNGRVLGAARFDAGTWTNVSVPLLRGTGPSSNYQVLLYADDGDRAYDLHKDILITGANGGVAGTNFKTL